MIDGLTAERMFHKVLTNDGQEVRWATNKENMFEHFDLVGNGIKYDVKTQKRFARKDKEVSDTIWLEWTNVRGNEGWLRGKADKIVFLFEEQFLQVDRIELVEFIKKTIPSENVKGKEYGRWFQRNNRKDEIAYLYRADIEHLIEKYWDIV